MLRPIYVPSIRMEHARALVHQRTKLVSDQTRCKSRILGFLMFHGLKLKMDKPSEYWSRRFVESLKTLSGLTPLLRQSLDVKLEEYLFIRNLVGNMTKQIRMLSTQKSFASLQSLIQGIPGIGLYQQYIVLSSFQASTVQETLQHPLERLLTKNTDAYLKVEKDLAALELSVS